MSDVDLLESVLSKDARLLANVSSDRLGDPTPCPDYDVAALVNHMAGWIRYFAATAAGRAPDGDPSAYAGDDLAGDFRAAADEIVAAWREHGTERTVAMGSGEMPGSAVLAMTLMEYVTHGCDLALATGQEVPFSDEELEATLAHARTMLPDDENARGGMFGRAITAPDDAPALDRLLGWMGRRRDPAA